MHGTFWSDVQYCNIGNRMGRQAGRQAEEEEGDVEEVSVQCMKKKIAVVSSSIALTTITV